MKRDRESLIQEAIILRIEKGYSKLSILKWLQSEGDVGQTMSYEIWNEGIVPKITEIYNDINTNAREEAISQTEALFQQCIKDGDKKNAIAARKMLNELKGLDSKELNINVREFKANFGNADNIDEQEN